jgi:hypothetical protein
MSAEKEPLPPGNFVNVQDLGNVIADGIARGMAELAPKRKTFGQYLRETTKGRPKLNRSEYLMNGRPILEPTMTPDEINLLNRITRSGRYINRNVEVVVRGVDLPMAEQVVEFRYNNKTQDQRNVILRAWSSFSDMLTKILTEQDAENAKKAVRV